MTSLQTLRENWKAWGIPAWIPIVAPWQRAITKQDLISSTYQPHLDVLCGVVGALSAMFVYAFFADARATSKRSAAIWLVGVVAASMAVLVVFTATVDITWAPGKVWGIIIDVVWPLTYMLTFVGFGGLVVVLLLLRSSTTPAAPSHPRESDPLGGNGRADDEVPGGPRGQAG